MEGLKHIAIHRAIDIENASRENELLTSTLVSGHVSASSCSSSVIDNCNCVECDFCFSVLENQTIRIKKTDTTML
ncbi:Uncharacterized protein APZ42_025695 [Daphnia magna]|uniref:Uncharacterized protein n=1 Tax=Daphnia magna TaxID=35525 RepID=A0A164SRI3_9CRUS|nr:Uncharacterized protein APZ42_025695 [Daphnia magna]